MMVFVAEITAAIDALGNTQTFYASSGDGFTTKPSDTPANTPICPFLLDPGNYRREMFSGNRTFGAVRPAFGEAVLKNEKAAFDDWRAYGFDGRAYTLRWGEQGAAYPSEFTTIFVGAMEGITMDFRELRIRLRDSLKLLEKPVLNETFAGTGDLEGDSALAGQAKQRILGQTLYPPPQIIDRTDLTYWISSGTGTGLSVWDMGVQLSNGGAYASLADLLATSPSAGEYRTYFGGPVIMRLGSNPNGDLRIAFDGKQTDTTAWNLTDFIAEAGYSGTVTGTLDPVGHLVDSSSTTYLDILTQSAARLGKFFGFNRLGEFEVEDFAAPTGTPVYTFTRHNTVGPITRSPPDGAPVPAFRFNVNAGRSWPSQLAGAAGVTRATFSRSPWYANYSHADETILLKHPSAEAINLDVQPSMATSIWTALRDKFVAWFFVDRDQITVKSLLTAETLVLDIGDVVEVKIPRFGYDAGKLFKIVAVRYDLKAKKIEHVLWG